MAVLSEQEQKFKEKLESLYKDYTVSEICKILNRSESSVNRYLRKYNLAKVMDRTDILNEDVKTMWDNGYTINEIASHYECAHETITKRLNSMGIFCERKDGILRHFERTHALIWPQIKADLDKGLSKNAVSRKYHMRYDVLTRHMDEHGYVRPHVEEFPQNEYEMRLEALDGTRTKYGKRELIYLEKISEYYGIYERLPSVEDLKKALDIKHVGTVYQFIKDHNLECFISHDGLSVQASRVLSDFNRLHIPCIVNDRSVLKRENAPALELDFYIPDLNLGIEVNPSLTHSPDFPLIGISDPGYHQKKSVLAKEKGIGLIHLYSDDLVNDGKYHKFLYGILSRMNKNRMRIGARLCDICTVSMKEYADFLDAYHFQGSEKSSSFRFGLYFDNVLVAVIGMGRARWGVYDYEIVRYCPHPDYIIHGCFDRLFSKCLENLDKKCSILAYVDMNKRFTASNVYERHGFIYEGITVPDYVWIHRDGTSVLKRYDTTKKKLIAQGYDESMTEAEIMKKRRYMRVYGAGSQRYVYYYDPVIS